MADKMAHTEDSMSVSATMKLSPTHSSCAFSRLTVVTADSGNKVAKISQQSGQIAQIIRKFSVNFHGR